MNVPNQVLEFMADAMLDPAIRVSVSVNRHFRKERIRVLTRAIVAAEAFGYYLVKVEDEADRPRYTDVG